jgi:hypothetical protein
MAGVQITQERLSAAIAGDLPKSHKPRLSRTVIEFSLCGENQFAFSLTVQRY